VIANSDVRAQTCPDAARITAGHAGMMATVRYLADDALGGRLAGTRHERCAGDYIAQRFAAIGLKPAGTDGTYFQSFSVASAVNPHARAGMIGRNVLGLLEGSDPQLKNEYIIVGAHYDHLGLGQFGSTSKTRGRFIHNGADDNASGVAAMLAVAERLVRERPARTVVFMGFSGEEEGLIGSRYFANNPTFPIANVRAMLNLDMVGRLGKGPLIVYGIGTAHEWEQLVTAAAAKEQVGVTLNPDGYGASDHTSFYEKNIPVLHFFTNVHGDYHNPGDDWDKIDAAGLGKVASIVTTLAAQAAHQATVLTLRKMPAPAPQGGGGYGAYLGTVPDFSPVQYGVKISGVREGSPAAQAGLISGDIIIRFDSTEIKDLQAMTDALRKRKPGEKVRITVLRADKEVVLDATFGKRGS
jgi:hypothetical protein